MIKTKINLTDYQAKKIAYAYQNEMPAKIHLPYEQIGEKR
jgi:hypothetical protein